MVGLLLGTLPFGVVVFGVDPLGVVVFGVDPFGVVVFGVDPPVGGGTTVEPLILVLVLLFPAETWVVSDWHRPLLSNV